jgi:hypothetical protein
MAVLKAYVDDSGDEGPGDAALSMAGYVATVEAWARFEQAWIRVLDDFEASYLHMKELKERYGAFEAWPESKEKDADFLAKLTAVIGNAGLGAFGAVVVLDDLNKFNDEHDLSFDAKALAIYASMMELRKVQPKECVEVILDRMNQGHAAIAKAEEYAPSEELKDISFLPLPKKGAYGAKDMAPLQAADLLAWEIRKEYELKKEWYQDNPNGFYHVLPRSNNDGMKAFRGLFKWFVEDRRAYIKKRGEESIEIPFEPHRRSLIALDVAAPINARIWNYYALTKFAVY